jgi:signal peptidase I
MKDAKHVIIEMAETFLVSFVIIMILYGIVAAIEIVSGASMEPTFYTNERILVDKISPFVDNYKRGDVVVFRPPTDRGSHYIKRVIGLPGETVKIFDCRVYIQTDSIKYQLSEGYLFKDLCTSGGTAVKDGRSIKIPEGRYLLLGDNRPFSVDSRYLGFIDRKSILGRVSFVLWPPGKMGFIN